MQYQLVIIVKRKDRCPMCQGRGWTLNDRDEPTPCKCRLKAEKKNKKKSS
jgi:hypothetical protein